MEPDIAEKLQELRQAAQAFSARIDAFREEIKEGGRSDRGLGNGMEEAECAMVDSIHHVSIRHAEACRARMQQVQEALARLTGGGYGICRECENPIDRRRLAVLPFAVLCRECQEETETAPGGRAFPCRPPAAGRRPAGVTP
ncbi:MAG: TraR/DksA C4-type zinc finger protein [Thermodesulfobacteriota bacterium]